MHMTREERIAAAAIIMRDAIEDMAHETASTSLHEANQETTSARE